MPKLRFAPGINKDDTPTANEGRWYDGDLVRFRNGRAEPIGGWASSMVGPTQLAGKPRSIHIWRDNDGDPLTAVGTHRKLYVFRTGNIFDITPYRSELVGASITLSTTNGSAVVRVTHTGHGAIDGDTVWVSNQSAPVGGITLSGEYQLTYVDTNNYDVTHSSVATSTASTGVTADLDYEINIGETITVELIGWGIGPWGEGAWGTGRESSSDPVYRHARVWSLDNWGEDLVASPSDGSIYVWDRSGGTGARATEISGLPAGLKSTDAGILVSDESRHLIAFGAHRTDVDAAYTITWCDAEDYTTWTPAASNTAGSLPLTDTARIVRGKRLGGDIFVWTDAGLHRLAFTDYPYEFGRTKIADRCGLMGPNAVVVHDERAYWMGRSQFYLYDGVVRVLPCTVWKHVFKDLNTELRQLICGGLNLDFNEVTWYYPSFDATENDKYVTYNYQEGIWYYGDLDRTAWHNAEIFSSPIGISSTGTVYYHEIGTDADGTPMNPYIESGDLSDGDVIMFLSRLIPDFELVNNAKITVKARLYPNGTEVTKGPFTITTSTTKIHPRARGRHIRVRVESDGASDEWRMGDFRAELQEDGAR